MLRSLGTKISVQGGAASAALGTTKHALQASSPTAGTVGLAPVHGFAAASSETSVGRSALRDDRADPLAPLRHNKPPSRAETLIATQGNDLEQAVTRIKTTDLAKLMAEIARPPLVVHERPYGDASMDMRLVREALALPEDGDFVVAPLSNLGDPDPACSAAERKNFELVEKLLLAAAVPWGIDFVTPERTHYKAKLFTVAEGGEYRAVFTLRTNADVIGFKTDDLSRLGAGPAI